MSDTSDLYQAPPQSSEGQAAPLAQGPQFDTMVLLGQAAPWLKFLGVMGYIGSGFLVLVGLFLALGMGIAGSLMESAGAGAFSGVVGLLVGVIYTGLGVLYFFPASFLFKQGKAAEGYKADGNAYDLKTLALNIRKHAKFYGILMIVMLAIIPFYIVGIIILAVSGAAGLL